VVVPEQVSSFECVNILNYYGFPVNVEEDNILRGLSKHEMGFGKEDQYPLLVIDSTIEAIPESATSELTAILNFLLRLEFISDVNSHSAKETQTMNEFLLPEVEPICQEMIRNMYRKWLFY